MSHFKTLLTIIIVTTIASACGAEPPPPTMAAADVQNTAIAAAFTVVAQTQAAIPTATPLPPTETPTQTPLPTNTALALQTQAVTFTPVAVASTSSGDHCDTRVLSGSPKGRETIIRIVNTTKAAVTVSLYLNETPDHFECGYRSYNLSSRNDVVITDLVQGCYNLWAFNSDPKILVNASGSGCINNPDKWTFEISQGSIKFVGP
jgi:hypothetical protein